MLSYWSPAYLLTKFVNNFNLALFISITCIALLWMAYSLIRKHFVNYRLVTMSFLVVLVLGLLQFIRP